MNGSFSAHVAEGLRTERFTLLDVGCSGGIDQHWRVFEPRLRALGIDASEAECRRLATCELIIPGHSGAAAQEAHLFLIHHFCEQIDAAFPA